jgi:hypothetical protein
MAPLPRWLRVTLNVLLVLGAILTALAAWMLMQPLFAAAMVASASGSSPRSPARRRRTPA